MEEHNNRRERDDTYVTQVRKLPRSVDRLEKLRVMVEDLEESQGSKWAVVLKKMIYLRTDT